MEQITKFTNCLLLRNHELIQDDLWVRGGKIINPEIAYFDEKIQPDIQIDCKGAIISPGFIDVQINGGFGVDFAYDLENPDEIIRKVAIGILAHGVTSFCPTLVSSRTEVYHKVLPYLRKKPGGPHGAEILGAHVEGPFISKEKRGAHDPLMIQSLDEGMGTIRKVYKDLDCVSIITIAPEIDNAIQVIRELSKMGILVSVGHSAASILIGEEAVINGASFITHLFNAMLPFHHRDPGLVGLLASDKIPDGKTIYYGLIADGNHTHPSTTIIAYRAHREGVVLVTDACSAMGLNEGIHYIGHQRMEIVGSKALLEGTNTLCGSVATMISSIHYFWKTTGCSLVEALEAATLHPAKLMKIENSKGTLEFNTDADFVLLSPTSIDVISTWISGECVYKKE